MIGSGIVNVILSGCVINMSCFKEVLLSTKSLRVFWISPFGPEANYVSCFLFLRASGKIEYIEQGTAEQIIVCPITISNETFYHYCYNAYLCRHQLPQAVFEPAESDRNSIYLLLLRKTGPSPQTTSPSNPHSLKPSRPPHDPRYPAHPPPKTVAYT